RRGDDHAANRDHGEHARARDKRLVPGRGRIRGLVGAVVRVGAGARAARPPDGGQAGGRSQVAEPGPGVGDTPAHGRAARAAWTARRAWTAGAEALVKARLLRSLELLPAGELRAAGELRCPCDWRSAWVLLWRHELGGVAVPGRLASGRELILRLRAGEPARLLREAARLTWAGEPSRRGRAGWDRVPVQAGREAI